MRIIGIFCLLAFIISCGKSKSTAGLPNVEQKVLPVNGSNIAGLYMAKFFTLNKQVNGTLPGSATIYRQKDKFHAYVRLFGGSPNAWHQQNIHAGSRCPNMGDDINKDGYIDIEEGNRVWGKVIIPLDSNIGSQAAGKNIYPVADVSGGYFYERITSFESMFEDLKSEDKNLEDNIMKLSPDKGFDLVGRVVVVHGTDDTVLYPETVASENRRAVFQTIPIACGVFSPVTKIPGAPLEDEIPGEVGEVDDGQTPGEPIPEPEVEPQTRPEDDTGYDDDYYDDDEDPWYDRVIDWWRSSWEHSRGGRRIIWG